MLPLAQNNLCTIEAHFGVTPQFSPLKFPWKFHISEPGLADHSIIKSVSVLRKVHLVKQLCLLSEVGGGLPKLSLWYKQSGIS